MGIKLKNANDNFSLSTFEKHEEFAEQLKKKLVWKILLLFIIVTVAGVIFGFVIFKENNIVTKTKEFKKPITTMQPVTERQQIVRLTQDYVNFVKMDLATVSYSESNNFVDTKRNIDDMDEYDIPILKYPMIGTHSSFFDEDFRSNYFNVHRINAELYPQIGEYISNVNGQNQEILHKLSDLSRAQLLSFSEQLNMGVRYFEMNIDNQPDIGAINNNNPYLTINFKFGKSVMSIFRVIKIIMRRIRKRIIIIHINKIQNRNTYVINNMLNRVVKLLGRTTIVKNTEDLTKHTMRTLYTRRKKFILIISGGSASKYFFKGEDILHTIHFKDTPRANCFQVKNKFCLTNTMVSDRDFMNPDGYSFRNSDAIISKNNDEILKEMSKTNGSHVIVVLLRFKVAGLGTSPSYLIREHIKKEKNRMVNEIIAKLKEEEKLKIGID